MAMRVFDNLPAGLALDANALAGLKQQARAAPERALAAAAGQFEALFMQMLLKSMREALPQDGPLASETTKMVTGMFDQQLAQQLANKGLGIADMMVKQLSRVSNAAGVATPAAIDGAVPSRTSLSGAKAVKLIANLQGSAAKDAPALGASAPLTGSIKEFIDKLRPQAEAAARAAGLPVTFLLAQAGLESGWGRHQPRASDGAPSHNLFGIKAGKTWTGPAVEATTTEHVAGAAVKTVERFRSYGSYAESLQDFARLVRGNPRYANVASDATNADAYALGMQKAGYATDPNYGTKLARAIRMVAGVSVGASETTARAPSTAAHAFSTASSTPGGALAVAPPVQVVGRTADSVASPRTRVDKA